VSRFWATPSNFSRFLEAGHPACPELRSEPRRDRTAALFCNISQAVIPPARRRRDRHAAPFARPTSLSCHPDQSGPTFSPAPPYGASGRAARRLRPVRFAGMEGSRHNPRASDYLSSRPECRGLCPRHHCHPDRSAGVCAARSGGIAARPRSKTAHCFRSRTSPQKQKAPELVRGCLHFPTLHSLPHFTNLSREICITPKNIFQREPVLECGGLPPLLQGYAPPTTRDSSAPYARRALPLLC